LSKYKHGVCPECKVKEGDSSKKVLYQCKFCERWFCAKHFEPRLAFIRDLKAFSKYPEVRVTFEEEWRREDGHPDFAYSLERFKELDMEEKLLSKLIEDALNRSKAYGKKKPRKDICPKCGARKQFITEQAFNKETVSMKCKICGFKWTQPRFREGEKPSEPSITTERDFCPSCHSHRKPAITYGEKFEIFECLECGFEWKVPPEKKKKKKRFGIF
jgi:DNA-directed RNA polymerase subunit M/transcription elongation factor TFIIS